MAAIPVISEAAYVAEDGSCCPFCRSGNIMNWGTTEGNGTELWQPVKCLDCDENWTETYTLTGFSTR